MFTDGTEFEMISYYETHRNADDTRTENSLVLLLVPLLPFSGSSRCVQIDAAGVSCNRKFV